jgi:hypothetical protein
MAPSDDFDMDAAFPETTPTTTGNATAVKSRRWAIEGRKQGQGSALDPPEAEPLDTIRLRMFVEEEGANTYRSHDLGWPPPLPQTSSK